ncbi:hypothetical protein AB0F17_35135 [Nonomuraea sp. NPDC026600]|uniref:hypothetical protein n=1 Tax=Nonomuraea sp. NPDC026600 TaxID=3155363 RepID=UPI0033C0F27F
MAVRSFLISLTLALAALTAARLIPTTPTPATTTSTATATAAALHHTDTLAMAAATFGGAVLPAVLLTAAALAAILGIAAALDPADKPHRHHRARRAPSRRT